MSGRVQESVRKPTVEAPRPLRATPFYRFVHAFTWLFCRAWLRLEVEGLEHVPAQGGAVICANHQSHLDILVVAAAVPRPVTFVARDTLAEQAWLAFIMRGCGAILIRRGASDRAAIREMAERLKAGGIVAIFPEGTRTQTGRLGTFKGGALMVGRMAGVKLVPAGIRGTYESWPRGRLFPRPRRVAIRFGPAIDPTAEDAGGRLEEAVGAMIGDGTFASVPPRA